MSKNSLDLIPREFDSWTSKDGSWQFFIKSRLNPTGQGPIIYLDLIKNRAPFHCIDIVDLIAQGHNSSKISMVNDVHIQLADKFYFHDRCEVTFGVQVFLTSILLILTLSLSYLSAKDPLKEEIQALATALNEYHILITTT